MDECWSVVVTVRGALGLAGLFLALAHNAVQQADQIAELPRWDGTAGQGLAGACGHCVVCAMVCAAGSEGGRHGYAAHV